MTNSLQQELLMPDSTKHDRDKDSQTDTDNDKDKKNPPRTTTGKVTSPKFGSAVSGGGDIEPGLKKN
ncbi:MAG: hypothetical protein H0W30_10420 [Gemmatimonadaceae bacterium]|nr:hypothetical protein [Gemmatimonadaceae bacterium]